MAATLSQLAVPRSWEETQRPQSLPQARSSDAQRGHSKSPNRVKARPANPVVINSILDSLDTLTPPPILTSTDESFFDSPSRRSRPYTANETIASTPSLISVSPGFGMEYGTGLSMNDESGLSNAALPPTVRTSRDPFGIVNHKPVRNASFWSSNGDEIRRSSSLNSRTSRTSFGIRKRDKERPTKYKLSSESWVKQGTLSQDSLQGDWTKDDGQSSLHRVDSRESLRPPKSRIELMPTPSLSSTMSRAEQIIALTSEPRSANSKRRIYLTDTGSNESQSVRESSAMIAEAPEPDDHERKSTLPTVDSVDSTVQGILEEYVKIEEAQNIPPRRSPTKSSIVDSIPMRTSSLRQSSSSPNRSKKKDRKSKRRSEIGRMAKMRAGSQRDSFVSSSSREISDSTWNDLGEDDETVKRIRELREQRQARMLEPKASSVRALSPAGYSEISTTSTTGPASVHPDETKVSPILRPAATRIATEPSPLSQKALRSGEGLSVPELNGQSLDKRKLSSKNTLEPKRRATNLSLDETKLHVRPESARSNTSSNLALSLDYSYADAVEALQSAKRDAAKGSGYSSVSPVTPTTPVRTTSGPVLKSQSPKSATGTVRSKGFRWKSAAQHPDLPLAYDKKTGRRSTSIDQDVGYLAVQPDSVEVAVNEYLRAKRLNRKIKHPINGRIISFSEVGDPSGSAVIVCLGMGLTRYVSAFYDELAATLRLRLVTIDRPGVGNSEAYPSGDKSGPLSWPDDVLAVCQHLGISKFSILAHSAGAIYALATALILPHLIKGKLHLLSPWIPPSQLDAYSRPAASIYPGGALPRSQRLLRVLPTPFFKAANASFMTAASASLKPGSKSRTKAERRQSTPPTSGRDRPPTSDGQGLDGNRRESMMLMDQLMPDTTPTDKFPLQNGEKLNGFATSSIASPMDPNYEFASIGLAGAEHVERERKHEYITLLTQRTWELATRDSNPATDLLVCLERHRDIGFRYTDVHQEVVITHGSEDKRVPVANVRWLAEQMNRHSMAFGASGSKAESVGSRLVVGGCEIRVLEGEAHGLMASPLIMGDILTEIAGYWKGRANV